MTVSKAVAKMALQWKGRAACEGDTGKGTWPFRSGRRWRQNGGLGTKQGCVWPQAGQA